MTAARGCATSPSSDNPRRRGRTRGRGPNSPAFGEVQLVRRFDLPPRPGAQVAASTPLRGAQPTRSENPEAGAIAARRDETRAPELTTSAWAGGFLQTAHTTYVRRYVRRRRPSDRENRNGGDRIELRPNWAACAWGCVLMTHGSDPLSPSRFPTSPSHGLVEPSSDAPSGSSTRPFGMGFAVTPPVRAAKHGKKPTREVKRFQTAIYDDGKISGYKQDEEIITIMDEE